ncbi:MAG: RND family efflux transporter MFP subunit [Oceanicoccus sp.]|jgi:RND family efflux transporter MFP subunit
MKKYIGIGIVIGFALLYLIYKPVETVDTSSLEAPTTVSIVSASDFQSTDSEINAVGEVESVNQVILSSEISGTVESIYAQIGDYVNAGDPLVQLESASYNAQLAQAAASIQKAQASLNQVLAGSSDQEVAQSAANLAQAQANLLSAEIAYNQSELSAEMNIYNSATAISTSQNNLNLSEVNSEYDSLVSTIKGAYTIVIDTMEDTDEILGIENSSINDSFEDALSARNSQALRDAENSYERLLDLLDEELNGVNSLSSNSDNDVIEDYADQAENILEELEDHLYAMINVMNSTPDSAGLSASEINAYVSIFTTDLSNAQTKISSLTSGTQSISDSELSYDNAVITYESTLVDYNQAKDSAEYSLSSAQAAIAVQEAALAASQAAYDLVSSGPRNVDVAPYEASIAEAYAAYQLASINQGKTLITAPISGLVSVMSLRAGELVNSAQELVSIVNSDQIQVLTYVSADDLKSIQIGDSVLVNESIDAAVFRISPSIDPNTKKVEITILITEKDTDLLVGEYVQIDVYSSQIESEDSKYFLPLAAVKVSSNTSYIYIVSEDGLIEEQEVKLGKIVGESVEVLSGLNDEDQFVSSVRGLSVGELVNVLNSDE